jgi:hypothetical protein
MTAPLSYAATSLQMKLALDDLPTVGETSVALGRAYDVPIGEVVASKGVPSMTSASATVDLTQTVAPGDIIRIGEPAYPTLIGFANLVNGNTAVTFAAGGLLTRAKLMDGALLRFGSGVTGATARVANAGVASARVQVTSATASASYRLLLTISGVVKATTCIAVSATASAIETAFAAAVPSHSFRVVYTPGNYVVHFNGIDASVSLAVDASNNLVSGSPCVAGAASDSVVVTSLTAGLPYAFQLTNAWSFATATEVPVFAMPNYVAIRDVAPTMHEITVGAAPAAGSTILVSLHLTTGVDVSAFAPIIESGSNVDAATALEKAISDAVNSAVPSVQYRIRVSRFVDIPDGIIYRVYFVGLRPRAITNAELADVTGVTTGTTFVVVDKSDVATDVVWRQSGMASKNDFAYVAGVHTYIPLGDALDATRVLTYQGPDGVFTAYKASGLTYEVSFDTNLGDVPAMQFDASGLVGTAGRVSIIDNILAGILPLSYTVKSLNPGQEYFFRVSTSNALAGPGYGPWSNIASAVPMGRPIAPLRVHAEPVRRVYEVQRITASAKHVLEVQSVTTFAQSVAEVQTIRTDSTGGALNGTFALSFNGVSTSTGFLRVHVTSDVPITSGEFRLQITSAGTTPSTVCLPYDATEAQMAVALSAARVKRVAVNTAGAFGYEFYVYYPAAAAVPTVVKDVPGMAACAAFLPTVASGASTAVATVTVTPETRLPFPRDVSADTMRARLLELPDILEVAVLRSLETNVGGYFFTVTLQQVAPALRNQLRLPFIACDAALLQVNSGVPSCTVSVDIQRNTVGGSFYLAYVLPDGNTINTDSISYAATAADVKRVVDDIFRPVVDAVTVTRTSQPDAEGGHVWQITFTNVPGDMPLFTVVPALTGVGSTAVVKEEVKGNTLGGTFTLRFGNRETQPISVSASASDMRTRIQDLRLPPALVVAVSRGENMVGFPHEGYSWRVTFSQALDLQQGLATGFVGNLTGIGAAVSVVESAKGALESGNGLAVSFDPPLSNGGSAVNRYVVEWDASPRFDSASPSDRGSVVITDADFLYRSQLISITAGNAVTGGASSVSGVFVVNYGMVTTLGVTNSTSRRSKVLPVTTSAEEMRDALQDLIGINAVAVTRALSRVPIYDAADGSISTPITASSDALGADHVLLSKLPTANQLSVSDRVWVGGQQFRVRAFGTGAQADPTTGLPILYLGETDDHTRTAVYAGFAVQDQLWRYGGGFEWNVTITSNSTNLQPFFIPATSLTMAGSKPDCLGAFANITGVACRECVYVSANVLKGQRYYVRAWAHNAVGRSLLPSPFEVSDVARSVPSAPLRVIATAISDRQIEVMWNPPADDGRGGSVGNAVLRYRIDWDPTAMFHGRTNAPISNGDAAAGVAIVETSSLAAGAPFSYIIDSMNGVPLVNGTRVYVRVCAENDVGFDDNGMWVPPMAFADNRAWELAASSYVITNFQVPGAPTQAMLQLLTSTALRLTFLPPARTGGKTVDAYEISISTSSAFPVGSATNTRTVLISNFRTMDPSGSVTSSRLLYDLTGLATGTPYFVRVRAVNVIGASPWALTSPNSEIPRGKADMVPMARVSTITSSNDPITTLDVAWTAPATTGGSLISSYVVEVFSDRVNYEVQRIVMHNSLGYSNIDQENSKFTLRYRDVLAAEVPAFASAGDVRRVLMMLSSGGNFILPHVEVSRDVTDTSIVWEVTFVGTPGTGQGDVTDVTIAASSLVSTTNCGSNVVSSNCMRVSSELVSTGVRKYGKPETQVVTIGVDDNNAPAVTVPAGFFRLRVGSSAYTAYISVGATDVEVKSALEMLPEVRSVTVVRTTLSNALATFSNNEISSLAMTGGSLAGWRYELTYTRVAGNVDGIQIDSALVALPVGAPAGSALRIVASDASNTLGTDYLPICTGCVIGELPWDYMRFNLSSSTFATTIRNLTSGRRYYVQVSAMNDRGLSQERLAACDPAAATYCSPDSDFRSPDPYGIRVPLQVPGMPSRPLVAVDPLVSSQLRVSYGAPTSDGGSSILSYRIEWSTTDNFQGAGSGKVDVPCPSSAADTVVEISIKNSVVRANGLNQGGFHLDVTHGGRTFRTARIAFNAPASEEDEVALTAGGTGSGIFCEYHSLDVVYSQTAQGFCQDSALTLFNTVNSPGSMEAHLKALAHVARFKSSAIDVQVSRADGIAAGEYVWRVTFSGGGDWDVQPTLSGGGAAYARYNAGNANEVAVVTTQVLQRGSDPLGLACTGIQRITGLQQGTKYYVRVSAYNAIGYGLPANAYNANGQPFQAPMRCPGRPTSVALTVKSGSELRVTFSPPNDNGGDIITAYRIEWGTGIDAATGTLINPSSQELNYIPDAGPYVSVIRGLTQGVDVYVKVYGKNSQGYGDGQQSTPTHDHPRQLPKAPLGVRLDVTSDTALTVGFELPSNDGGDVVSAFRIEWDTDPEFEGSGRMPRKGSVVVPANTERYYTISSLTPGEQYYVRVAAGNRVGFGLPSYDTPNSRVTDKRVAGRPYQVVVARGGACRTIDIQFSPPQIPAHSLFCSRGGPDALVPGSCPSGAMGYGQQADGGSQLIGYEIQFATHSDWRDAQRVQMTIPVGSENNRQLFDLGPFRGASLQPGQRYYVRVAARNSIGVGPFCDRDGDLCSGDPLVIEASGACTV